MHRELFNQVSASGSKNLVRDMTTIAVACMRHFIAHPQQYQSNLENIKWQLIVRMWKQTFHHCSMQELKLDEYKGTKAKLLNIDNQWIEELYKTTIEEDLIQTNDSMVKRRTNKYGDEVPIRSRIMYNEPYTSGEIEELCGLE